jgi:hypothetical protein
MVLSETDRLQLFGVIRGGLIVAQETSPVAQETSPVEAGQCLTVSRRLSLEPKRQPQRGLRAGGKFRSPAGSWLALRQLAFSDARR